MPDLVKYPHDEWTATSKKAGGDCPAAPCSPNWRSHAFMYSDATDTLDNIRHAARDYAPKDRRFFYESVREQLEALISEENAKDMPSAGGESPTTQTTD